MTFAQKEFLDLRYQWKMTAMRVLYDKSGLQYLS